MSLNSTAVVRLNRDFKELIKDPLPNIRACPSPNSILTWHYIFVGDRDSPFEGGYYHGTIKFPPEYPFKPPHYSMHMSNGRFVVGKEICITNSNYHSESWSPLWTLSGILTGFVAFFMDQKQISFVGSAPGQSQETYRKFAKESHKRILESSIIRELFPDVIDQIKAEQNGTSPKHRLPFPPQYYSEKERDETTAKQIAAETINYEQDLQYDSCRSDEEDE